MTTAFPKTFTPHRWNLPPEPHEDPQPPAPQPDDAVVISDIHLGSDNCQAKPLAAFLETLLEPSSDQPRPKRLIINGNVFDSIDFRRLRKTHWRILSLIRHLSDKLEVVWIAGNHDGSAEIISHLLGTTVVEQYTFTSGHKKVLCIHGHVFDRFIDDHPLLTWIADCIYFALQKIDRTHYIARFAKARSKTFIRCVDKIRDGARQLASRHHCHIAICGHTHHAEANAPTPDHSVAYYNSGCWTENPASYLSIRDGQVTLHHTSTLIEAAV